MKNKLMIILLISILALVACQSEVKEIEEELDNKEISELLDTDAEQEEVNEETAEASLDEIEAEIKEVTVETGIESVYVDVFILGIEEYDTIEDENNPDVAEDGEKIVVAYVKIINRDDEAHYFNYNYLTSEVDGENISTTFLMNDPKEFSSLFNKVPALGELQGYLVYKVPEDWNEIKATYVGWESIRNFILDFSFAKEDLKEVDPFGSEFTAPYKGGN